MFESFVIMLREGIEAALVIGIIMVVLKRTGRRDLEHPVFWGLGIAVFASIGTAVALNRMPLNEEAYEGCLYMISAVFVASMMWWMHQKARTLKVEIEKRVFDTIEATASKRGAKEAWGLGSFAFLMVFREGAETVMFLSAVSLTTDAVLSFIGTVLGLVLAIVFCVMFIQGSLHVNVRRFFTVTEWVLGVFVFQLIVNGYHEFSEAGILPATQQSMSLVGPMVRHNSLFILALIALPLFIWLTAERSGQKMTGEMSSVEKRLIESKARRDRNYRYGAVASALIVLFFVGAVYAKELMPKTVPLPEPAAREGDSIVIPLEKLEDGKLHRLGYVIGDRTVRFLAMKTGDGKYRTGLDLCRICGDFGYIQQGGNLICLNCAAEIAPMTLGHPGGCNPLPLESTAREGMLLVPVQALESGASQFHAQSALEGIDPVCGMRVKLRAAAAFETFNRKTYYFCSNKCQAAFKVHPSKFIK